MTVSGILFMYLKVGILAIWARADFRNHIRAIALQKVFSTEGRRLLLPVEMAEQSFGVDVSRHRRKISAAWLILHSDDKRVVGISRCQSIKCRLRFWLRNLED